jgi:hypothetical protein
MPSDTKNVKMGVCQIFFDGEDQGYTIGGVEVSVTTETRDVQIDQFGQTPVNKVVMGRSITVKAPLAETTIRRMLAVMPGATLVTNGVQASGTLAFSGVPGANSTVTVGDKVFTYKATAVAATDVRIGASTAESVQNLAAAVNLLQPSISAGGVLATVTGSTVTLKCGSPGVAGNAIVLSAQPAANANASNATLTGGVDETKARVDVPSGVGLDLLAIAKTLRLHPKEKAATDLSEDLIIPRAATPGGLKFAYKVDADRVFDVEWSGFPDPVTGKLFSIGDPTAV